MANGKQHYARPKVNLAGAEELVTASSGFFCAAVGFFSGSVFVVVPATRGDEI